MCTATIFQLNGLCIYTYMNHHILTAGPHHVCTDTALHIDAVEMILFWSKLMLILPDIQV